MNEITEDEAPSLWYDELNFCGCYMPDATKMWLAQVLESIKTRSETQWKTDRVAETINNPKVFTYFVLYVLDAVGWTEHGSSVGSCWLTDKGIEAIEKLKEEEV